MYNTNYDIKAYNFGILFIDERYYLTNNVYHLKERLERKGKISPNYSIIIQFDEVDGLTIPQILNSFNKKEFIFYSCISSRENTNILKILYYSDEDKRYDTIDKLVEEDLIKEYNNSNVEDENLLRVIKCYLKRYRYETKEEIDKVLKLNK